MKLRIVEPRQGVVWVKSAIRAFLKQPIGFAAVFATGLFVVMILSLVPIAGTAVLLVMPPVGTLVFMIASRWAVAGKSPMPGAITELLGAGRQTWIELLKMGLLYAALTMAAGLLASVVDGGAFQALRDALSAKEPTPETIGPLLANPRLQLSILLFLTLSTLVSIPYWHAPALVHWGKLRWSKALFFSAVAVWRNKSAFTVYGLAWMGLMLALSSLVGVVAAVLGAPQVAAFVMMPLTLALTTVFYASLWFTFDDSFTTTPEDPAP